MAELKDLIKEGWLLFIKELWLKKIHKKLDKFHKVSNKQSIRLQVINELLKAYNEKFNENLRMVGGKNG
jgi:hypothetical protein